MTYLLFEVISNLYKNLHEFIENIVHLFPTVTIFVYSIINIKISTGNCILKLKVFLATSALDEGSSVWVYYLEIPGVEMLLK